MISSFESETADDVWRQAAKAVLLSPEHVGRGGKTRELLHVGLQIRNPRERWITSRREALNVAFALAEVIWILAGDNSSAYPTYFNSHLPRYAGSGPVFHGAYGTRLCSHLGFDQLQQAAAALRANPSSRQIVLQIWDGRIDLAQRDGRPTAPDVPCNIVSMLKVRDGKLDWTQIMRSNDAYRGLPHNIVQFTSLQEIFSGWIGTEIGVYTHWSDSLHFYEEHLSTQTIRPESLNIPPNLDSLALNQAEFAAAWPNIKRVAYSVADIKINCDELRNMLLECLVPDCWRSVLTILVAEGIRRRGFPADAEKMRQCATSPSLRFLYKQWLQRVGYRTIA